MWDKVHVFYEILGLGSSMPAHNEETDEHFVVYKRTLAGAIGDRVRKRRIELGLTQEMLRAQLELANVYITRSHFSRIETGASLPVAHEIIALTLTLRVSPYWLLFGSEERTDHG